MAKYRALSTPSQANRQINCRPTAPRTRPTRRRRPRKARLKHTMLQLTTAISATMTAVQCSRTTRRLSNNQSLDPCSSSNYDDAFVTFKALPPPAGKKTTEKVKRSSKLAKNKRKTIASSNNNARTWCMPSLSWPQPKASMSPWLSLQKAFDAMCQWTVLFNH